MTLTRISGGGDQDKHDSTSDHDEVVNAVAAGPACCGRQNTLAAVSTVERNDSKGADHTSTCVETSGAKGPSRAVDIVAAPAVADRVARRKGTPPHTGRDRPHQVSATPDRETGTGVAELPTPVLAKLVEASSPQHQ
jgi:hypothetical protein